MKTSYLRWIIILSLMIKPHSGGPSQCSECTTDDLCISGSHNSDHHGTWNYAGIKHDVHQDKDGLVWRQSSTETYLYPHGTALGVQWLMYVCFIR